MRLIYISDTNIWIDFRNAGLLEQMFRLPFTLCCTDFVMHELEDFPHHAGLGGAGHGAVAEVDRLGRWAVRIGHGRAP